MRLASPSAGPAKQAAYAAQKLQQQREAAAAARSHANTLQIKVVVAFGCILIGVAGFALHRTATSISDVERAPLVIAPTDAAQLAAARTGRVELPYKGDTCRRFNFDNRSGAMTNESIAACGPTAEAAQATNAPSRTEAIMSAFRVNR